MVDFSHLKKIEVNEQSEAEYTFYKIPGEPSIWFRPMTEANPEFILERVRSSVARQEKEADGLKKRDLVAQVHGRFKDDRAIDKDLIARTCALRWGRPFADVDGKVHDLDPEITKAFLDAMPYDMVDDLRSFLGNDGNFRDQAAMADLRAAAEKLGKP